ncbi:hypothetical protein V8E51_005585 [Hyaloscypha variabilis]
MLTSSQSNFHEFDNGYNASGSISMPGPRVNDSYPASTWTWSKYIVDLVDDDRSQSTIWQQFGLQTSPLQNLSDPSLPFTGCAIGFEDPTSAGSKTAENDDGTCTSVLTPDCVQELIASVNATASSWSGTMSENINCLSLLPTYQTSSSKCYQQWSGLIGTQFLPASFSSTPNPGACQGVNPGDSNAANLSFFGWSDGTAAPDNFTYYDRAIRSPTPFLVAMWLKPANGSGNAIGVSSSGSSGAWADTQLLCIPGNKTEPGSRSIETADQAAPSASSTPTGTGTGTGAKPTTSKPSDAGRLQGFSSGMALLVALVFCLAL